MSKTFYHFPTDPPAQISENFDVMENFTRFSDGFPLLISESFENIGNFLCFSDRSTFTDIGKFRRHVDESNLREKYCTVEKYAILLWNIEKGRYESQG